MVADDEILWAWAKDIQGVEPDVSSASTVFRRVKLHEGQVRKAARDLPFECEPANFRAHLDGDGTGESL